MTNKITRRNIIKSLAGTAIGLKLGGNLFAGSFVQNGLRTNTGIDVKILPPGPKSLELMVRMKNAVGRTNNTGLYGVAVSEGKGSFITDLDGNTYLDCLTAASSNILGYGNEEIVNAYAQTAHAIQNTAFGYTPNIESVELAEKLIEITPGNFSKKVMLGVSGSDSAGGAIEAVRKYSGKMGIISFNYAYHGSTGLSQQASGFKGLKAGVYADSQDFIKIDFPSSLKMRDQVLKDIEAILAWGTVGAVMVEPIQGDAGIVVPYEGFFPRLMEILQDKNVLLIDDEIQSGMGRTGKWWAIEHENVVPDMVVSGKGLSGGYAPVSAVIGRAEIMDALDTAQQIFTYTGHGPSATAALKVIQFIGQNSVIENAGKVGARLLSGLEKAVKKYPDIFTEVRGRGLMIGLEINKSKNELANKIFAYRCLEKGIYFGYFGPGQKVIRIEPPLTLSESEADTVIDIVNQTAIEMTNNKIPEGTISKVKQYALGW